jgi:hypothetical protein
MHVLNLERGVSRGLKLDLIFHLFSGDGQFAGPACPVEAPTTPRPSWLRQGQGSSLEPLPDLLSESTGLPWAIAAPGSGRTVKKANSC